MPPPRLSPAQRFAQLKKEVQQLEFFCTGTVLARTVLCGRPNCACRTDPAKRHGPYWEWTYKVHAKTVHVRLTAATGPLYQAATQQRRKLQTLLRRLEGASRKALAALAKNAEADVRPVRRDRSSKSPA
jgi:hypothetical protein